jgi:hypothetical protein
MKKVLCVIAVLALVATASASVRMVVTGSNGAAGLTDASTAFVPCYGTALPNGDYSNMYDYYYHKLAAGPAIGAPSGTLAEPVIINQALDGEFAYIWFQFIDEPGNSLVNGLKVEIINTATGLPATGAFAYYKQDDRSGGTGRRWDGTSTQPNVPEFTNNPQTLVLAATAGGGIQNLLQDAAAGTNWNMFDWQAGTVKGGVRTGVSLIGATNLGFGTYSIHIRDLSYASGTIPSMDAVGYFKFMPEPASLLLMGLAGLLLRRR